MHVYIAQHCFFLPLPHVPVGIRNAAKKTKDPGLHKGNAGSQTLYYVTVLMLCNCVKLLFVSKTCIYDGNHLWFPPLPIVCFPDIWLYFTCCLQYAAVLMPCNCEDAGCFMGLSLKMEIHWQVQRESSDSSEGGGDLLRREMDVLIVEALLLTVIIVEVVNWCKHGYPPFSFFYCILVTINMLIILPL